KKKKKKQTSVACRNQNPYGSRIGRQCRICLQNDILTVAPGRDGRGVTNSPHTSDPCWSIGIHDGQHYGGDPGDLAVRGVEDLLDVLEVDGDGLGEGVGEADGDEGAEHHGPAPAPVRRGDGGTSCRGRHLWPVSSCDCGGG
ncbi:hypothetical protein COCON_G00229770, partial [Conger conger]